MTGGPCCIVFKLKCEDPVGVLVKVHSRLFFGVIGAGLDSHRTAAVCVLLACGRDAACVALGAVVQGRLVQSPTPVQHCPLI